jgi:sterol desaturase/sphingolipid hydroxylase (fatty acid hydroxylase superfamily)
MSAVWLLPMIAFGVLALIEQRLERARSSATRADHLLNVAGLIIQGSAVPAAGYLLATQVLAVYFPQWAGSLALGWWGAFALNFVFVDFLYYWQHRLFHHVPWLWALHRCHHAATDVNVWTTSRNSLAINILFVYLPVNALLGFLCDVPQGFFAGAAVTACLDLWRHSRVPSPQTLTSILVTPLQHHAHHGAHGMGVNYGANLIVWDRLFGTERKAEDYPARYGVSDAPGPWRQFLFPWRG